MANQVASQYVEIKLKSQDDEFTFPNVSYMTVVDGLLRLESVLTEEDSVLTEEDSFLTDLVVMVPMENVEWVQCWKDRSGSENQS